MTRKSELKSSIFSRPMNPWSRMVRGPLIWLGERDPVDSKEEVRASDPQRAAIHELLWSGLLDLGEPYSAKRILELTAGDQDMTDLLAMVVGENGKPTSLKVGQWLAKIVGHPVDGRILERVGTKSRPRFKVEEMRAA
jgi:hypothetical protein